MPVGFVSASHVLPCESPTHNSVIVVLHTSTPQSDVIETGSISSLRTGGKGDTVIDLYRKQITWSDQAGVPCDWLTEGGRSV